MIGALALCGALAAPAGADDCAGVPGYELHVPATGAIGQCVDVTLLGPANQLGLFMISLGDGPLPWCNGHTICLDFPLVLAFVFPFDDTGTFEFGGCLDCDPSLVGLTVYLQYLAVSPVPAVSNQCPFTIVDGICDGDLCTFTNGGWGSTCRGKNPGCRRDKHFDHVFPGGLTIGDPDGIDGDGDYALHFSSSAAVEAFLPGKGTPATLDADAHDPTDSSAGVFAGQLVAATLNVAFDDAGELDDCKGRTDLLLGDLVLVGGVDDDLLGYSVRDLLGLANAVISGALGSGPYDLDGDSVADVTLSDISDALAVVNENFDDGTSNQGNLGLP